MEEIRTERVDLYACGSFPRLLFRAAAVVHTGVLTTFDLHSYAPGFLLRFPDEFSGTEIPSMWNCAGLRAYSSKRPIERTDRLPL